MLAVTKLLLRQNYVLKIMTKDVFWRDKHVFVVTKVRLCKKKLSRQAYICCNKRCVLSRQTSVCVCHNKTFVTTKMILVAAPASDIFPTPITLECIPSSAVATMGSNAASRGATVCMSAAT